MKRTARRAFKNDSEMLCECLGRVVRGREVNERGCLPRDDTCEDYDVRSLVSEELPADGTRAAEAVVVGVRC